MSLRRRAAAPRLIEWTGERCVPWAPDIQVVYEHLHRYLWAARVIAGRRVLDLGSGEGFGAAILAESATQVVGIDVDERTVEHSRLNYWAANLEYRVGSALDLSDFADGSFGAVVAFEIIEHVRDQERVLDEVQRLLGTDGVLIVSTPDRRLYSEASGGHNPFHERELGLEEFHELVGSRFPHLATWGQRTITGSHMSAIRDRSSNQGDSPGDSGAGVSGAVHAGRAASDHPDFYIERTGEEWRVASDPAALYMVAIASKAPLPTIEDVSTLADCGLELLRVKEREQGLAEHRSGELSAALDQERSDFVRRLREQEAKAREQLAQLDSDLEMRQEDIVSLRATLERREAELVAATQLLRRTEESVTWQTFQRARARVYGAIGEGSLLARVLGLSLRTAGKLLAGSRRRRSAPEQAPTVPEPPVIISLPEHDRPTVSLIIPLYAHANLTRACLESIRENTTHVSYEVILVEDDADEETKRLLEGVRGAKIVHNERNLGYLRSMNLGASKARGRWLVLFNNDTEVTRGWLREMLECAESADDIGVVTPKFLYPDGSLNEAGGIIWRDGTGMNYGRGQDPSLFQYEYRRETDYGSAAALMVSTRLWQDVGGFDEYYLPMYYEDVDLCFQARERGLRVLYEPGAVVIHLEGATAGNDVESGHKRHQEENRPKFVAKWRHRLESEHLPNAYKNGRVAANRHRGRHVLVIDHRVPTWDRDAGSLRMLRIMQSLISLGARVTFMPDNFSPLEPYTRALQKLGVEVLYGALDVNAELAAIGPKLDLAILSRPHQAGRWLDVVREFAPSATVAYDTVDLHWLREARRSMVGGGSTIVSHESNGHGDDGQLLVPKAQALRHLELAMIRAADATIVVSSSEQDQVQRDVPGAEVIVIPTVHDIDPHVPLPEDRSGILFVGGFEHHPNVDAAVYLVKEVMPVVWRELGDVKVTIVGSQPPPEVETLASPLVDVAGWVKDLQPLIDRARAMVAPLRFGAGLKGKITQALAEGLPVVTTEVGAEGLEARDEPFLLVGQDAAELAAHIIRLYNDDELWRGLSRGGQELIVAQCSTKVLTDRLARLLERPPASAARIPSGE